MGEIKRVCDNTICQYCKNHQCTLYKENEKDCKFKLLLNDNK